MHTPLSLDSDREGGTDLSLGIRGNRIGKTPLQPYVFGSLNTSGDTNFLAAGLSARFGNKVYYGDAARLEDIAAYYSGFDRLIAHWREVLPADRFTEVAYEDVVGAQEPATRRLVEFCGLVWNDACLRPHENVAGVATASAAQVRAPVHDKSVGRWRKWGPRLEPIRAQLQAAGVSVEG